MIDDAFPIVLVVDDDRAQVAVLASYLKHAGFRVLTAPSGVAALAALERAGAASDAISLLITDMDMPGMDGRTFARTVRQQHPLLGVLYVTGSPDALFRSGHVLGEREAFLEKPVTEALLREAVNILLPARTGTLRREC
jgi:CheY-like chemotaxis protein